MTKPKRNVAQEHAIRVIKKYGGVQIKRGKDKGKFDMTKGVKAEEEKGRNK